MKLNDLVSIILLTYNSSKKVLLTLESIALQDYKNIEIIISDDASSDDTVSIIEKYIKKNKAAKIVFIKNKKNLGTVANYQNALLQANGVYIKPIGAGDLLYSKKTITHLVNKTIESGKDFIFGFNCSYKLNTDNNEIKILQGQINPEPYFLTDYFNVNRAIYRVLECGQYISGSTFFYKKKFILENLLPDTVIYLEDVVQVLLVLKKIQFDFLNEYIVLYEFGDGVSTSNKFTSRLAKDHLSFFRWIYQQPSFRSLKIIKYKIYFFENYHSVFKRIIYYTLMRPGKMFSIIFDKNFNIKKREKFNIDYSRQLYREDNFKYLIEEHYLKK